jgi:hypothetical protein
VNEFDIDARHRMLLHDVAKEIRQTPDPDTAAAKAVNAVAQWLTAPATDLALPEQMHYSNHSTAQLLRLGAPIDD